MFVAAWRPRRISAPLAGPCRANDQATVPGVSTSGVHWLNGRLNKWVERVRVCGSQALQATGLRRDGQQAIGFVSA